MSSDNPNGLTTDNNIDPPSFTGYLHFEAPNDSAMSQSFLKFEIYSRNKSPVKVGRAKPAAVIVFNSARRAVRISRVSHIILTLIN